jgi:hypothetical protein
LTPIQSIQKDRIQIQFNQFRFELTESRFKIQTLCQLAKYMIAHILSVFCRQARAIIGIGELDMGNEYMAAMDRVPGLEAFVAVIYSSNLGSELAESDNEVRAANLEQSKKPQQPSFVEPEVSAPASQPAEVSAAIGAEAIQCVKKKVLIWLNRRIASSHLL